MLELGGENRQVLDGRIWIWMRRAERAISADGQAGQDKRTRGVKDDSRICGLIHRKDEVTATKLRKTTGRGGGYMVKCNDVGENAWCTPKTQEGLDIHKQ